MCACVYIYIYIYIYTCIKAVTYIHVCIYYTINMITNTQMQSCAVNMTQLTCTVSLHHNYLHLHPNLHYGISVIQYTVLLGPPQYIYIYIYRRTVTGRDTGTMVCM